MSEKIHLTQFQMRLKSCTETTVLDFGRGFWQECRRLTGKRIDTIRGQNIPHNSRCIDRTLVPNGIASHKSTDVRLKSYRSGNAVYRLGLRFVRELASYKGEVRCDHKKKATYHLRWAIEEAGVPRVLEWFVPDCGVSSAQELQFERVIHEAAQHGVTVRIYRVAQ